METNLSFDPGRVAYLEKAGWQAYYDRKWLRVLRLMVALNRQQFHMSSWTALLAAFDIVRASAAFTPPEGDDIPGATGHLQRFYEQARRALGIQADAETLARLEMDYWVVHCQLAIQRAGNHELDNIEPLVEALTQLHAALFGIALDAARRSAALRARAAMTVDRITGRYSTDVDKDWQKIENDLQQAYRAVQAG